MNAAGFAEQLDLANPVTGKRFRMRLEKETPIESSKQIEPGGTARVLEHVVSCELLESVALLGCKVEGGAKGAKIRVMLDGEDVLKGVLEGSPAEAFAEFLPTQCLFYAETPEGVKAGMFMPNGTMVHVVVSIPRNLDAPVRILMTLQTALYTLADPSTAERPRA